MKVIRMYNSVKINVLIVAMNKTLFRGFILTSNACNQVKCVSSQAYNGAYKQIVLNAV